MPIPASDRVWMSWLDTGCRFLQDQPATLTFMSEWIPRCTGVSWANKCSEYITGGRFFCSIVMHEGEEMFNLVTIYLGNDVLTYASDCPHSECRFPDSADHVLAWST